MSDRKPLQGPPAPTFHEVLAAAAAARTLSTPPPDPHPNGRIPSAKAESRRTAGSTSHA